MVASRENVKQHVLAMLETLPEEALSDVAAFLDFQQYRIGKQRRDASTLRPVALGGLWRGMRIDDDDIADVRREMWDRFTEDEP